MDAYPLYGPISIRTTSKPLAGSLDGHYAWQTRVTQAAGTVAAMEAWIPGGASATMLVFGPLPDVVLFDVDTHRVRYQAFSRGEGKAYNGQRLWNQDAAGIQRKFHQQKQIPISDPDRGVFIAGREGEWYRTTLAKGFVTAAWHGRNDWDRSPPCGCLIRKDQFDQSWTTWSSQGYVSYIVQLDSRHGAEHPNLNDGHHSSQALYVEGRGLGCWENIEALDQSWNAPLELQPIVLQPGQVSDVRLLDTAGLRRPVEIVLLPKWCGVMQTEHDLYRGRHTVLLLQDVAAGAMVRLGKLPLELVSLDKQAWVVRNTSQLTFPKVLLRLPVRTKGENAKRLKFGKTVVDYVRTTEDFCEYQLDVPPGETKLHWPEGTPD